MKMTALAVLSASTLLASAPRAVFAAPRADVSNPQAMIDQIKAAFEEFKTTNDASIDAKFKDVVTADKLDAINATITELTTAIDVQARLIEAAKIGNGGVIGDLPASEDGYIDAFKLHMRKGVDISASMKKAVDADGGFLAPIEWDRTITSKLKRISMIRQNARVISISSAGFKKMFNDRLVGSGWVGEIAARPETTTPQIGSLDFIPGEIYANPAISQGLLDDAAVDLEQWLADEVDTEFNRQEGIAFLSGDGVNKPFGILNYVTGGTASARHPWGAISVVNSGNASTLGNGDALLDLVFSLPSEFAPNAKWYVNRLTLGAMRKLKDGQGNYLWQPSYALGTPQTFAGYEVVEMPDMPIVAANNISALFGDMEATYLVVDRVGIRVLRDPFTNKPFVMFYTTKRVGGGVFNPEPMRAFRISI